MKVLNKLNIEPYGYSHGDAIGVKFSGVEPGYKINFDLIDNLLVKRKGSSKYNTTRSESEKLDVLSGFNNNITNGDIIHIEIKQNNFKRSDYEFGTIRPGHADLSAYQKYGADYQFSGGGQFSGRLTVLYVIIGEIARQILEEKCKLEIIGHVSQVGTICDEVTELSQVKESMESSFPMVSSIKKEAALTYLSELKANGDSIGGKLDLYVLGGSKPYGDDFFGSLESKISFLMYSVPAVKAVEFGIGTDFATSNGSGVVEQLYVDGGKLYAKTNYNGGINGGIANGVNPIKLSVTIKPTSTIFKQINTVKYTNKGFENDTLHMRGRHDSFIANRALWPVIGLLNVLFLDLEMEQDAR